MIKKSLFLCFICLLAKGIFAQSPEITSWILNTSGATGYNNIPSNIQQVQYSDSNVYVSATCIPGYDIGPWPGNPNTPANQNFVFKITRFPQQNTGTSTNTPLGHIGIWSNGVSIFNAKDAFSYNNQGVWNRNAIVVEGASFDTCLGHPAPNGEYHHHLNPRCLYDDTDSLHHSPIIGYAFDGYPIYGAYGFANTNGTGGIKRMESSFHLRAISTRTTLPDGTVLSAGQYGPAVSATYPLSYYIEDFQYTAGYGDLDEHNGRFCITPDYPAGTYAYFVTLDSTLTASYPYTFGPTYYGRVIAGNTGPGSGHVIINESVQTYVPTGMTDATASISYTLFPSPAKDQLNLFIQPVQLNNFTATVYSLDGREMQKLTYIQPSVTYTLDLSDYPAGMYYISITDGSLLTIQKFIHIRE